MGEESVWGRMVDCFDLEPYPMKGSINVSWRNNNDLCQLKGLGDIEKKSLSRFFMTKTK